MLSFFKNFLFFESSFFVDHNIYYRALFSKQYNCLLFFTYSEIHYTAIINYFSFDEMYCFGDIPIFFLNTFEK